MLFIEQSLLINVLRIAVCIVILGYSCITDWRSRRAPQELWEIMTAAGVILLLVELIQTGFDYDVLKSFALSFIMIFLLVNFIYYFMNSVLKGAFGGADANALLAMSVLFPYYPILKFAGIVLPLSYQSFTEIPFWPIFTLSVFGNALVMTIVLPLSVLAYNLVTVPSAERKQNRIPMFLGYRMPIETAKERHVRLMHVYEEEGGKVVRTFYLFRHPELSDELYKKMLTWKKAGKMSDLVWVTPKIPLLIPITLGFIVAVLYGDVLTQIMTIFLVR
jgi:preflagellin peptidase FlaK